MAKNKLMITILAVIMAAPLVLNAAPVSQFISAVRIKGNINVPENELADIIKTKPGDAYSPEALNKDAGRLLETRKFESVAIEIDTGTWIAAFVVTEKPMVKKLEFKGNKKFSQERLKEEVSVKEKGFLDSGSIEADIKKLVDLYSEKGYADTQIDHDLSMDKAARQAVLTFFVSEGRKVTVESVKISGARRYSRAKIAGMMETKRKKILKTRALDEDIKKITDFYRNNGFESVSISSPGILYNEDRTRTEITLNISEGPQYRIAGISFSGNTVLKEEELRKVLSIKPRQLYKKENIALSQAAVAALFGDKGYLQAEVTPELTKHSETGLMDVNFSITENRKIFLGKIFINGLTNTRESVIRRELLLKENDILSSAKLKRSLEKIYNLGFIDDIKYDIQDSNRGDTADLVISVTEGQPGMLRAGAGYSSVDKLTGTLQVNHLNLFGRAQKLDLSWEFGERLKNYEIGWTEPWFMQKPLSLGAGLYDLERKQYSGNTYLYTSHKQGVRVGLGPRLSDNLGLLFTYAYEDVIIYNVQTSSAVAGKEITSSITSQIVYDTRDNMFDPSTGSRNSFSVQVAGGPLSGDAHFWKPMLRSSWFFPAVWKFIFAANASIGYVQPYNGYVLQPIYRLYAGGQDSVRGYSNNELTPSLNGGTVSFVGNVEYKFPIIQKNRRTVLQGAVFYDFGGTWDKPEDMRFSIGETSQWKQNRTWDNLMKSSWGVGVRLTTPIFPIRVDAGWPNQKPDQDADYQVHITVGQMF